MWKPIIKHLCPYRDRLYPQTQYNPPYNPISCLHSQGLKTWRTSHLSWAYLIFFWRRFKYYILYNLLERKLRMWYMIRLGRRKDECLNKHLKKKKLYAFMKLQNRPSLVYFYFSSCDRVNWCYSFVNLCPKLLNCHISLLSCLNRAVIVTNVSCTNWKTLVRHMKITNL